MPGVQVQVLLGTTLFIFKIHSQKIIYYNKLSIWVVYKTFSHVTGCLYFNVIYRPSACASTLEF